MPSCGPAAPRSVTRRLGPELSPATAQKILAEAGRFTHVVVSAFVRVTSSKGTAEMDPTHAALLESLAAAGAPLVVVSFGSPYLLAQFPHAPAYVCAYGSEESSQRAAIAALYGEFKVTGRLPVSLPGLYLLGHGIELARRPLELEDAPDDGPGGARFAAVDALLEGYVAQGAFPGGVVLVGQHGKILHQRAFGKQTCAADAPPVGLDTIYDLASLTKVIATTTAAMILVDEERLDLGAPVQRYLPLSEDREKKDHGAPPAHPFLGHRLVGRPL